MQGVSFGYSLGDGQAESRHRTQYFEMMGHRSLYHDGWRAVCPWPGPSFAEAGKGFGEADLGQHAQRPRRARTGSSTTSPRTSRSATTSPKSNRDRLIALIATWYAEAGKYDVLPVDGSGLARFDAGQAARGAAPQLLHLLPQHAVGAPSSRGRACSTAPTASRPTVGIPDDGAEGVLLGSGHVRRRVSFYLQDGRLRFVHNWVGREKVRRGLPPSPVPPGDSRAALRVRADRASPTFAKGHGHARPLPALRGRRSSSGPARFPSPRPFAFNPGALTCGADPGSAVTTAYPAPFRLHRHTPQGHGGPLRRAHPGQGERAAGRHGQAIARRSRASARGHVRKPRPPAEGGQCAVGGQ